MSTNYRALCTELLRAWQFGDDIAGPMNRARAELAKPEPVAPTDEEIMELMPQQMRDDLAAAASALACGLAITGFERDSMKAAGVCRIILNRHAVDHARAVLARYGTPAIQPVPVSERLPGPEDCDGDGRCWIFMPDIGTDPSWRLTDPRDIGPYHTHSLPHHALPTPEATNA
jgi:hypothetical protein